MASKRELEIKLSAAQEEFARYDERLSNLAEINKKLETCYDQLRVAQTDAEYFKHRAEAAERRVAELEAAQEWRPVTNDMELEPDDHESVLVVCAVPDNQVYVTAAEYTCDGHWWWLNVIWREHKNVTHWRPLPQPPTPSNSTGLADSASRPPPHSPHHPAK